MPRLTDEQFLQIVFVVGPFLSLIGSWLSVRAYTRFQTQKKGDTVTIKPNEKVLEP